jgi:hypothetical protein
MIVAGDGYAYLPYACIVDGFTETLMVLRVNSGGNFDNITVAELPTWIAEESFPLNGIVTNADTGIVFTFQWLDSFYMAVTTGTGATLISAPQVPGAYRVAPVLQAQDGSFVGTDDRNDMIAFDLSGNVRWVVPNETPQIATADGGVIGQSGIAYDANGNATGIVGNLPVSSWIQQWYTSTLSETTAVAFPSALWATSFQAVQGGNPSSNGTAVGLTMGLENAPLAALADRGPDCKLGSSKVPLTSGAVFNTYADLKYKLISGNYLTSTACSNFFASTPLAYYFQILTPAVNSQQWWDGVASNISAYSAGFLNQKDLASPTAVDIYKQIPVCGYFIGWKGVDNRSYPPLSRGVTAASQIHSLNGGVAATDVYLNTRLLQPSVSFSQGTVLHEVLHNITSMYNQDLETALGIGKSLACAYGNTFCISLELIFRGCAGVN